MLLLVAHMMPIQVLPVPQTPGPTAYRGTEPVRFGVCMLTSSDTEACRSPMPVRDCGLFRIEAGEIRRLSDYLE